MYNNLTAESDETKFFGVLSLISILTVLVDWRSYSRAETREDIVIAKDVEHETLHLGDNYQHLHRKRFLLNSMEFKIIVGSV